MFSLAKTRIVIGHRNGTTISHLCKRHLTFEEKRKELEARRKGLNPSTADNVEVQHVDPHEFRNIGPFKSNLSDTNNSLFWNFFIKKNNKSIFSNVVTDSWTGIIKNILANAKAVDQCYNPDRVNSLGPDLAAAHFVVCRGGGVKFVGEDKFIRGKKNKSYQVLPSSKDPNYKVEAIDFENFDFVYEALGNLIDLKYLTWVSFKNCKGVNNWYLDYLSSIAPGLEYLNLSGCHNVNHLGLSCFYRFKKLKCVNVEEVSESTDFKLACLTMETEIPDLVFIGLRLKPIPKSVFNS